MRNCVCVCNFTLLNGANCILNSRNSGDGNRIITLVVWIKAPEIVAKSIRPSNILNPIWSMPFVMSQRAKTANTPPPARSRQTQTLDLHLSAEAPTNRKQFRFFVFLNSLRQQNSLYSNLKVNLQETWKFFSLSLLSLSNGSIWFRFHS